MLILIACVAALARRRGPRLAQSTKIDLRTAAGADAVKGQWRYHDVKIIEVEGKNKDGSPNRTYSYEPKAKGPEFDDSDWEVIEPETLKNARANGQICFCWYRIKVTMPPEAEGKSVFFQTTVDDYGEIWVDGKLPRKPGDTGGPIVAGFNFPNRVELKDPEAGQDLPDRRSSASTARSPTRPPTGSSWARRSWSWSTRSEPCRQSAITDQGQESEKTSPQRTQRAQRRNRNKFRNSWNSIKFSDDFSGPGFLLCDLCVLCGEFPVFLRRGC